MIGRMAIAVLVVAAVAAIAIVANLALLNYASSGTDPVGRLKPQAQLPSVPPAPASVIRPRHGRVTHERADD